jgi:hypothetical protein
MRLILLLLLSLCVFAEDYSRLKEHKQKNRTDVNDSHYESNSRVFSQNTNKMIVRFEDINSFNFSYFEEVYKVNMLFCIADGLCVFENKSAEKIDILIEKIRKEKRDISEIKLYQNYKMRPF